MVNLYIDYEFFAQCPDLETAVELCRIELHGFMDRHSFYVMDSDFIVASRYNHRWHFYKKVGRNHV